MMMMGRHAVADAARAYLKDGGWRDARALAKQLALDYNARVVIQNAQGTILGDSDPRSELPAARHAIVLREEGIVGYLLLGPPRPGANERLFLRTVYQWLVIGALLAGGLALGVGYLVTRRLTCPLETLTEASRRMAAGDHGARVAVESDDEVGALSEAFNDMAESVQRSEMLRRRLIGDVAHELRTPLTTLRSRIEALRDRVLLVDESTLASLSDDVLVLSGLVSDLQELSLAEWGKLTYRKVELDLAEVIAEEAERFRVPLESKGVDLNLRCAVPLPCCGDRRRLRQVVRNLVDNAAKHTDEGSVTVRCDRANDAARFEVSDTGSGILSGGPRPRVRALLPRRHGQGAAAWRDGHRAHDRQADRRRPRGRIEAHSQAARGTTMIVEIPAAPRG